MAANSGNTTENVLIRVAAHSSGPATIQLVQHGSTSSPDPRIPLTQPPPYPSPSLRPSPSPESSPRPRKRKRERRELIREVLLMQIVQEQQVMRLLLEVQHSGHRQHTNAALQHGQTQILQQIHQMEDRQQMLLMQEVQRIKQRQQLHVIQEILERQQQMRKWLQRLRLLIG
ncbi:uncharacterized protein V6R79_018691 [Siganus canaliculatus]